MTRDNSLIVFATEEDAALMSDLAAQTFRDSHGSSAQEADIDYYINTKCSAEFLREDLKDPANFYHLIYHEGKPAGYSKIILNCSDPNIEQTDVTKLERIYLLKEFYGAGLASGLLDFNINLSKRNGQAGIWLFVWKENYRAMQFYKKNGFEIVGSFDFQVSPTHSNPNYQMWKGFADH